jgi:site-specific DNA recombinase
MTSTTAPRRAIGIVRVSETKGRAGDSFASPDEQRDRIAAACERDHLQLVETIEELDVSGGAPLERRAGLRRAVEAVEARQAEVIVAAYFDRLVRSLRVQDELVSRVERAGGQVLAVDVGAVTNGSAGQWLSGTMLGAVSEYQRRTAAERSREAQARAMARGVAPYPNVPPGYQRGEDGVLVRDPVTAPAVAEAFRLRAGGSTVAEVREHLRGHGIERSFHGTQALLSSRVVLGELHFGDLEPNLSAHDAIVDRKLWQAVQRVRTSRGRRPKSDRLLARLGVLRCASCGSRMVVGSANHGSYPLYRCPPTGDCENRVTISAERVEGILTDAVRERLAHLEGRASAAAAARAAIAARDQAQAKLDAAIRTLAELTDEPATIETISKLQAARDAAQEKVDRSGGEGAVVTVTTTKDWTRLSLPERRDLIRATIDRVDVAPGRGADRVAVHLLGE